MAYETRRAGGVLRLIFAVLRRTLWFGLGVADCLGQHLTELVFSLRLRAGVALLPICHRQYMGMVRRKLNPWLVRRSSFRCQSACCFP